MNPADSSYLFGLYRLDCRRRVLQREGELVALPPRQLDILIVLVQHHGELVEKDELMRRVWGGTVVEEGNLPVTVHALRRALGGEGDRDRYIQTVPRRGYRFVAPVRPEAAAATAMDPGAAAATAPSAFASASLQAAAGSAPAARRLSWPPRRVGVPAAVAAIVAATVVVAAAWVRPHADPAGAPLVGSIAILPLAATRDDMVDEALGWALADGVAVQLAQQREVAVRPGAATLKYSSAKADSLEAGRALQVDAVLEGTVQASGAGLRLTANLVRVVDGARLWSLPDEARGFADVETAQLGLTRQLAVAIRLKPDALPDSRSAASTAVRNPVAQQLLHKGRHQCSHASPVRSAQGLAQLEQAAALEPTLAPVHAAIASCLIAPVAGSANDDKMPRARAAARRALDLDERQAAAHAALAFAGIYSEWDWAGARGHFERAIELQPQDLHAHLWYAMFHSAQAQHDQALEEVRVARRIDPSSSRAHITHGYALYMARRHDQAVEVFHKAPLELGPANHQVLWGLGLAHVQRGDRAEAFNALQGALTRTGQHPAAKAYLAFAHARFGEAARARALLEEIASGSSGAAVLTSAPPVLVAPVHGCLGERDRAFVLLEEAFTRRDYRLIYIGVDPMFDCLRADPRFATLLRRIGVVPGAKRS